MQKQEIGSSIKPSSFRRIDYLNVSGRNWLDEVLSLPLLTKEEFMNLFNRYRQGDLEARNEIVLRNLRLVREVAGDFSRFTAQMKLYDLIDEGVEGLIRALEKYDPNISSFSTYALPWIRQCISRSIQNKEKEIRKSVYFQELLSKYRKLVDNYTKKQLPIPSAEQLSVMWGIALDTAKLLERHLKEDTISENVIVNSDNNLELEDTLGEEDVTYDLIERRIDDKNLLLVLKENLSPDHYYLIFSRYYDGDKAGIPCKKPTLRGLAPLWKVSQTRVNQLERKALGKALPYVREEGNILPNKLEALRNKEGKMFDRLNIKPITPIQIIKYMYLRDCLSDVERQLLYLTNFGRYTYTNVQLAQTLGISLDGLQVVMVSLKRKEKTRFLDTHEFQRFKTFMIETYGRQSYGLLDTLEERSVEMSNLDSIRLLLNA